MPESEALPGAPPRIAELPIREGDHEYAPVAGLWELREAIAGFYNELFRRGHGSKYSAENVAVSGGGRSALTRVAASLGNINLGHFLPDYTAYEELLSVFRLFTPIPILLEADRRYHFGVDELRKEILGRGLSALLLSNPCNPTGVTRHGAELDQIVTAAQGGKIGLLVDEAYELFHDEPVSAMKYVRSIDDTDIFVAGAATKG